MRVYKLIGIAIIAFIVGYMLGLIQATAVMAKTILNVLSQMGMEESVKEAVKECLARQGIA